MFIKIITAFFLIIAVISGYYLSLTFIESFSIFYPEINSTAFFHSFLLISFFIYGLYNIIKLMKLVYFENNTICFFNKIN
jgi:hypothetical protein